MCPSLSLPPLLLHSLQTLRLPSETSVPAIFPTTFVMPATSWTTATRTVSTVGLPLTMLTATWASGLCVAGSSYYYLTPCSPTTYISVTATELRTASAAGATIPFTTVSAITDRGTYCWLAPVAEGCQHLFNISSAIDSSIEEGNKSDLISQIVVLVVVGVYLVMLGVLLCFLAIMWRCVRKRSEMRKARARTLASKKRALDKSVESDKLTELPKT